MNINTLVNKCGKPSWYQELRWLALTVILLLYGMFFLAGCAQKRFTVEGKLLALASRSPLAQVALRLQNIKTGESNLVLTDNDGKFVQDRLFAGNYRIISADTSKFLVSPDTFEIKKDGEKVQQAGTLRGLQSPPKTGVYAWIEQTWREIPPVHSEGASTLSRDQAYQAVNIPESASLLVWLPGHSWGESRDGVNWVMATFADSVANFLDGELHERTPKGEPAPMDPAAFPDWRLPGTLPLRGPSKPNLYAIEATNTLANGVIDRVLFPFWIPGVNGTLTSSNNSSSVMPSPSSIFTAPVSASVLMGTASSTVTSAMPNIDSLPPGTQALIQRVLSTTLATLGIKPSQPGQQPAPAPSQNNSSDSTASPTNNANPLPDVIPPPERTDISQTQATRWREQILKARNDPDVNRRRQLWRAIRDSAEGTDISLEADKLLMRDLNGLPLK